MSGNSDSRAPRPRIDAAAKAAFINALCRGERREDAAKAIGFTLIGLYGAKRRDPAFSAGWSAAMAASAAAERRARTRRRGGSGDGPGEERITANARRPLQRRWMRNVRFDEERRALFFTHFVGSCDTRAAAEAAGVSESTVNYHVRTDPGFEAEFVRALEKGYVFLEAEALRQRLAAQRRLRDLLAEAPPDASVPADLAAEFERVMKLLARHDRKPRRPDRDLPPGSSRRAWTFENAIALLERRLKVLGVQLPTLAPDLAARFDGPGETGDSQS